MDDDNGCTIVTRKRRDGHIDSRITYSREFILQQSSSPLALIPFKGYRYIKDEIPEIIPSFPKSYYNQIKDKIDKV